jgi:hypothetical protein
MQIWNNKQNESPFSSEILNPNLEIFEVLAMMAIKTAAIRLYLENGRKRFLQHGVTLQHPESFRKCGEDRRFFLSQALFMN